MAHWLLVPLLSHPLSKDVMCVEIFLNENSSTSHTPAVLLSKTEQPPFGKSDMSKVLLVSWGVRCGGWLTVQFVLELMGQPGWHFKLWALICWLMNPFSCFYQKTSLVSVSCIFQIKTFASVEFKHVRGKPKVQEKTLIVGTCKL